MKKKPIPFILVAIYCGLVFLLVGIDASAPACAEDRLVIDDETRHLVVDKGLRVHTASVPLEALTVADITHLSPWQPVALKGLNGKPLAGTVWLCFDVTNDSGAKNEWLLEIGWPFLNHIRVAQYHHSSNTWSPIAPGGDMEPLAKRFAGHRYFLFPLVFSSHERSTVYIGLESRQIMFLRLALWQSDAFWIHDRHDTFFLGVFFGILAVMFLYNLSLYLFVRDSNYLFYSVYVLTIILYELAATGIGGCYIWHASAWLKQTAYLLFASSSFLSATIFLRYFLTVKKYDAWLVRLNDIFLVYWTLMALVCLFPPLPIVVAMLNPAAASSLIAGLVSCIYLWTKGNIQAKYYTIAYVFVYVGTAVLLLGLSGVIPRGPITDYGQMAGFVVEFVLLSIALAERINRERKDREKAQRVSLKLSKNISRAHKERLLAQEQLLKVQHQAKEELEQKVESRTQALQQAMQELEIANQKLADLSYTDPLTTIFNRRYFDKMILDEFNRAQRSGQPVSLALVDIDHFKNVNDTYGHLIGDECLRLVAHTLRGHMGRTTDFLARYGGEEFIIILPSTPQDQALTVADRLRAAVEAINFISGGNHIPLTVSIGVAGWIPAPSEIPAGLIQAADNALYRAKANGRNRVVASQDNILKSNNF